MPLVVKDRDGKLIPFPTHRWENGVFEEEPFVGGVRGEIHELLSLILHECDRRGYNFMSPGCWGFACRATKTSSGSQTTRPSTHSWGLAVDINAPQNPFGSDTHNIPGWMPELFHGYGFRWLGPPIKDWMHFDFVGSPRDAERMTERARVNLGTTYRFRGNTYRRRRPLLDAIETHLIRRGAGDFEIKVER